MQGPCHHRMKVNVGIEEHAGDCYLYLKAEIKLVI